MLKVFIALCSFGAIVLICEAFWRLKLIKGEYARKSVHVLAGIMLAFLPYFLSWHQVLLVGLVSLIFIGASRFLGLTKSWYDIERKSWGEVIGPATFLLIAITQPSRVLFTAVVLHVALADGFAAVIGKKFGKSNQYKVLGYKKSVIGTATFVAVSFLIMVGVYGFKPAYGHVPILALFVIPPITAAVENISFAGIDNALISLAVVLLFALFKIN